METFVYCLYDSRQPDIIRYIGITKNIKDRLVEHRSSCSNQKTHKDYWMKKVISEGGEIKLSVIEKCKTRELAQVREKEFIKKYKGDLFAHLTNITIGGDGGAMSTEYYKAHPEIAESTRKRMIGNKYALGLKHSIEVRQNQSKLMQGNKRLLGHIHSLETRGKMKDAHKDIHKKPCPAGRKSYKAYDFNSGELLYEFESSKQAQIFANKCESMFYKYINNCQPIDGLLYEAA